LTNLSRQVTLFATFINAWPFSVFGMRYRMIRDAELHTSRTSKPLDVDAVPLLTRETRESEEHEVAHYLRKRVTSFGDGLRKAMQSPKANGLEHENNVDDFLAKGRENPNRTHPEPPLSKLSSTDLVPDCAAALSSAGSMSSASSSVSSDEPSSRKNSLRALARTVSDGLRTPSQKRRRAEDAQRNAALANHMRQERANVSWSTSPSANGYSSSDGQSRTYV
jgi:hypothetical protein